MNTECDLLVIGSGAAGLAAAITAAHNGLSVIVAEKSAVLGGTTAWSGGWIWAPGNPPARRAGLNEDMTAPRQYLEALLGPDFNAERVDAFLHNAPKALGLLESLGMEFEAGLHIPDTYGHLPGAGKGGRSVIAAPYDGRAMGALIENLRRPLRETAFMGMTIQAGADLRAFMTMTRSPRAFAHVARRFTRHLWDLLRHGRGMQLRNGNALVARMLMIAQAQGVQFRTLSHATRLLHDNGRVTGAVMQGPAGATTLTARQGVVLAAGGFAQNSDLRGRHFPAASGHRSLAVPEATGDSIALAAEMGAELGLDVASPGAWCPVSELRYPDGSIAAFPHIIERGKPGIIGVLQNGKRFCNEGLGYHDYVKALLRAAPANAPAQSWLICTRAFQRRYGLGISRPRPLPLRPWLARGYITSARTLTGLAEKCGIDPAGLAETVRQFNQHAANGNDPEFGRGTTPYMRLQGDPLHGGPNPCVAPIAKGPFLALRVIPGSFGTFAGLPTDGMARVLRPDGRAIAGLYAAGGDMQSVFGGHYPAGGINLGPALTFGYIAGQTACDRINAP